MIWGISMTLFPQTVKNGKTLLKIPNKGAGLVLPDFKVYYAGQYPWYRSGISGHWGKDKCAIDGAKKRDIQGKEGNIWISTLISHENQFLVDWRLKQARQTLKHLEDITEEYFNKVKKVFLKKQKEKTDKCWWLSNQELLFKDKEFWIIKRYH